MIIGRHNRHEWLFHIDPNDPSKFLPKDEGGVQQLPQPGLRTKYTKEARGLFGVMMYDDNEGNTHGDRMQPLNYTHQPKGGWSSGIHQNLLGRGSPSEHFKDNREGQVSR